ncbi:OmpA family protein [Desulforhopalus singaporensis]|nr:OmpA family protein [Desulforhopalus singaporensis]
MSGNGSTSRYTEEFFIIDFDANDRKISCWTTNPNLVDRHEKWETVCFPGSGASSGKYISIETSLLFDFDSSELKQDGDTQRVLDSIVTAIANFESLSTVTVIGYTDEIGSSDYNSRLSLARSKTIGQIIQKLGVDQSIITVIGRGKENPIVSCPDDGGIVNAEQIQCLAPNRRVEIIIEGEVRTAQNSQADAAKLGA